MTERQDVDEVQEQKALSAFVLSLAGSEPSPLMHIIKTLTDTSALEQEHAKQQNEYDVVEGLIRRLIAENAQVGLDPEEYTRREAELLTRYDAAKSAMTDIEAQIQERKNRRTKLAVFIRALEKQNGLIAEFDEQLWNTTVESVTVFENGKLDFNFKG